MEKRKYLDGQQEEYKEGEGRKNIKIRRRKEEYKDQGKEGRI